MQCAAVRRASSVGPSENGHRSQQRGIEPLHLTGKLVRSLESIAAQHSDEDEVVAVCEKWTHRLVELERQAIDAGVIG